VKQPSLVIITLLLLLTGCLSTPCDKNSPTTFIGHWRGTTFPSVPVTFDFKADGTYNRTFGDKQHAGGMWLLNGDKLLLNETASYGSNNVYDFTFFNNCGNLNLKNTQFSEKFTLTRS